MNCLSSKRVVDGCTIDHRYTLYLNHTEFWDLWTLFRVLLVPYPTDENGEGIEEETRKKMLEVGREFTESYLRRITLQLDELSKMI